MGFDLEALIPLLILLFAFIFGGSRRRKTQQRQPEDAIEMDAQPESQTVFPPFMENFEGFPQEQENIDSETDVATPTVVEQPEPEPMPEKKPVIPPVPVDSPTQLPTKPIPVTSLIDLSPQTFRQGIILSEILGRPKGMRRR